MGNSSVYNKYLLNKIKHLCTFKEIKEEEMFCIPNVQQVSRLVLKDIKSQKILIFLCNIPSGYFSHLKPGGALSQTTWFSAVMILCIVGEAPPQYIFLKSQLSGWNPLTYLWVMYGLLLVNRFLVQNADLKVWPGVCFLKYIETGSKHHFHYIYQGYSQLNKEVLQLYVQPWTS